MAHDIQTGIYNPERRLGDRISTVVLLLMAIGTVFVFSSSVNVGRQLELREFYNYSGLRQLIFFPAAVAVMFAMARMDYRRLGARSGWLKSPATYFMIIATVLVGLVLFPQIGTEVNMARRWFRLPIGGARISFQPSELAKWAIIIFLAAYCARYRESIHLYFKRFLVVCMLLAVPTGLIIVEDFGTAAFICLLAFLILFFAGARFWHLLSPLPVGALAFAAVLLQSPARMDRIRAFLNPEQLADSAAYQANQSLIALSSGGLFGRGLGRGISKYGHLPEDSTDFIFAIIGEEMGFVGAAVVILLFIVLMWLGMLVVIRCKDRFGQLLAAGITLAIGIQAAVNIGVVTVVLPTKGIPLPFISAGGTSLMVSAAAAGILISIAYNCPSPQKRRPNKPYVTQALNSYIDHKEPEPMAMSVEQDTPEDEYLVGAGTEAEG